MNSAAPQFSTTLSLAEMEAFIRRVVREAMHEEFARVLPQSIGSIVDDWSQEGPEDSAGDQLLLAEALAERERYRTDSQDWQDWDEFKTELRTAEAEGRYRQPSV